MSTAADEIIGLYRRHGVAWARRRSQHLPEKAWLDRFIGLMKPQPMVLDLGCGFGHPIAAYLRAAGCRVTGVDTSPELLALAEVSMPDGDWIEADMRGLDLGREF